MDFYKKKLQEKKEYPHKKPEDPSQKLKKTKMKKMKHTKKNAQFGMF